MLLLQNVANATIATVLLVMLQLNSWNKMLTFRGELTKDTVQVHQIYVSEKKNQVLNSHWQLGNALQ